MPVGFSIAVSIIFIAGGIYCRGSKRLRTTSKCMLFFGCLHVHYVSYIKQNFRYIYIGNIECQLTAFDTAHIKNIANKSEKIITGYRDL